MKFAIILWALLLESIYGDTIVGMVNSASVFAVLDLKKVASESSAGKDIEAQIEAINKESKKDLLDLESKIKSMESNKKSDYDTRKIEELQIILYDMVRTKKYQISEAYRKAIAVLDLEMRKVIKEITTEKGIQIVMNVEAVVYLVKDGYDITAEVINRLNKVCKSVKVTIKDNEITEKTQK
jgi:Skp family chaperone for outer membrane proteins